MTKPNSITFDEPTPDNRPPVGSELIIVVGVDNEHLVALVCPDDLATDRGHFDWDEISWFGLINRNVT